jgi:hypothetical protein
MVIKDQVCCPKGNPRHEMRDGIYVESEYGLLLWIPLLERMSL